MWQYLYIGSYMIGWYPVLILLTVCDEFHYGLNCEKTCDCLIGSDYCDSVLGCICKPGWAGKQCGEDKNECDAVIDPCSGILFYN